MKEFLRQLFGMLNITANPDLSAGEALKVIEEKLAPVMEQLRHDAVAAAIATGKIYPDERDWALDLVEEHGLAVFAAFCEKRRPVAAVGLRPDRAAGATRALTAVEKDIARQVGVSEAAFLKYNGAGQ
jgi:phage I-like protein